MISLNSCKKDAHNVIFISSGYYSGIGGSVLISGGSRKDCTRGTNQLGSGVKVVVDKYIIIRYDKCVRQHGLALAGTDYSVP